ncbi:hypothetical protein R3Q06_29730 [Rhodococcus erythropolis]|uniref:hypothetical protein n=1 Tax=Rhodococcus erythropolis TaxID=1833 RepID=UPI00294A1BC4|nr:hypothetical protein [Rhodococcus erythropolis]MDV6277677.1 hypothetical protein [Rhodococcus erythropolis]
MTRTATVIDRVATCIAGLLALALGVAAILWNLDVIKDLPARIDIPWAEDLGDRSWWPWVVGVGGALLVLLALRWLISHVPLRRVKEITVQGSNSHNSITADLGAVAEGASAALDDLDEVSRVRGKALVDRGVRTIDVRVTLRRSVVSGSETLPELVSRVANTGDQIRAVVGDPSVATRTRIAVESAKHDEPRTL